MENKFFVRAQQEEEVNEVILHALGCRELQECALSCASLIGLNPLSPCSCLRRDQVEPKKMQIVRQNNFNPFKVRRLTLFIPLPIVLAKQTRLAQKKKTPRSLRMINEILFSRTLTDVRRAV